MRYLTRLQFTKTKPTLNESGGTVFLKVLTLFVLAC